jgi:hypothetical protein
MADSAAEPHEITSLSRSKKKSLAESLRAIHVSAPSALPGRPARQTPPRAGYRNQKKVAEAFDNEGNRD